MASLVGCLCCSTSSSKFDGKLFRSLCINMLLGCLRHLAAMTMDVMLINSVQLCWNRALKETHTICFSSSLYIINQKPMIPRTHFHCMTTWVAPSSGGNSAMHLLVLWFQFTSQIALLSNINFYFDCKTRLCLIHVIVPGRQEEIYFCTRKFLFTRYTR